MLARAPASSANLGPGFDTLAVALALYVEVSVKAADSFSLTASGEGAWLPTDRSHLAARVAIEVVGHDRLAIDVRSEIPVGRGLGSSAAVAVAAAAAAGASDPLAVGAHIDGHPENAAASVRGGLVGAALVDGVPLAERLPLDPHLMFVAVVPDHQLPTKQAREALPPSVPHSDARFNLGRMALLVAGLADHRLLRPHMADDRLHQRYRAPLFPQSEQLLQGLVAAGALAACWSGAGPSVLGICATGAAGSVARAGAALLDGAGLTGRVLQLAADHLGVTTSCR